jgi:hypothetical protein
MGNEIKYTANELVEAVKRIQSLGDYDKEVEASRKAGEILNSALDAMEDQVVAGVVGMDSQGGKKDSFDNSEFGLS